MIEALAVAVREWIACGGCVIPVATDRSKRPAIAWRELQTQRPSDDELLALFEIDTDGAGLVCGRASGELEMIELEGRAVQRGMGALLVERLRELQLFELWQRIVSGYLEASPGDGLHTLVKISDGVAMPNTVLAATADHEPLIETRGEGGFTVIAPSFGRSHPTGRPWRLIASICSPQGSMTVTSAPSSAIRPPT